MAFFPPDVSAAEQSSFKPIRLEFHTGAGCRPNCSQSTASGWTARKISLPAGATEDIAARLRVKPAKVAEWITRLVQSKLIDNDGGVFSPHNWDTRQYKSDVTGERRQRPKPGK
jgi:hypothetical protein